MNYKAKNRNTAATVCRVLQQQAYKARRDTFIQYAGSRVGMDVEREEGGRRNGITPIRQPGLIHLASQSARFEWNCPRY